MTNFALDDRYTVPTYEPIIVTPAKLMPTYEPIAGIQSNSVPLKAELYLTGYPPSRV